MAVTSQPSNESELQLYRVLQRANLLNYYDTFISQGRVKGHYETTVSIVSSIYQPLDVVPEMFIACSFVIYLPLNSILLSFMFSFGMGAV